MSRSADQTLVVIGHYQKTNALARMFGFLLICVGVGTLLFYAAAREPNGRFLTNRPLLAPLFILGCAGTLYGLTLCSIVIKRVLFDNGRAVWLENGALIFLHKLNSFVSCAEIAQISTGTSSQDYSQIVRSAIVVRLRSGQEKKIPTGLLIETENVILDRLKKNLPASILFKHETTLLDQASSASELDGSV